MYAISQKLCRAGTYHTPEQAKAYYGRYSRDGITVHWWNSPNFVANTVAAHDNIVNYIYNKNGGSVNYVVSNFKITMMVHPDNVAWASQSGNATTVSIEFSPHLDNEGYKKAGWLISELEKRYNKGLKLYKHSYWNETQCPGTLDLNRMRAEADKWKRGDYNPKPAVPTTTAKLAWTKLTPKDYICNKPVTNLWAFNRTSWNMSSVKTFKQGDKIRIYGKCVNETLNATYLVTEYSYVNKIANGFNIKDLDLFVEPKPVETPPVPPIDQQPQPAPVIRPIPVEPTIEQRVSNLEQLVGKIVEFLQSVFKNFNK